MRVYDDDDEPDESWRYGPRDEDDEEDKLDESPDARDVAEEGGNVRCVRCNRYIHEDADMCPFCHQWQTDEFHPPSKARWYVMTVILCVLVIVFIWILLRWL